MPENVTPSLIDATIRALSGRSAAGERRTVSNLDVRQLVALAAEGAPGGTRKSLAAELGVHPSTLRRWVARGAVPGRRDVGQLRRMALAEMRSHQVSSRRAKRIRSADNVFTVRGDISVSSDTRNRAVSFTGSLSDALDAYLAGDDRAAAEALAEAVGDQVPGMFLGDVQTVTV